MQKHQALITDIKDAMKETLDSLEELKRLDVDFPFEAKEREMVMRTLHQQPLTFQQARSLKKNSPKRNVQKLLGVIQFIGRSSLLPMLIRENRL